MATKKAGKKHILLFYKHSMDRVWRSMLLLALVLIPVWYFAPDLLGIQIGSLADSGLILAMVVSVIGTVFAFMVRRMAYLQVKPDHVLLATPFLRLKVPFNTIKGIRPIELGKMYHPRQLKWADRRFLLPYFGQTVMTLALKKYPRPINVLKMFLPKFMFNPKETGFVLLVKDWMTLSTEFDSKMGAYRDQHRAQREPEGRRGLYG